MRYGVILAATNSGSVIKRIHLISHVAELGSYHRLMQKKIFKQPKVLVSILKILSVGNSAQFGIPSAEANWILTASDCILILTCGTSTHSGSPYWLVVIAPMSHTIAITSEYHYLTPVVNPLQPENQHRLDTYCDGQSQGPELGQTAQSHEIGNDGVTQ